MRLHHIGIVFGIGLMAAAVHSQEVSRRAKAVTDPGVITTSQAITPAGVQSRGQG